MPIDELALELSSNRNALYKNLFDARRRLRGEDPATRFPGTAAHLRACPGCRADHDGLIEAARRFGDLDPE